jgi:hypothetical protein
VEGVLSFRLASKEKKLRSPKSSKGILLGNVNGHKDATGAMILMRSGSKRLQKNESEL